MTSDSELQHIPEETLEQYSLGRLSELEIEPVEEHLLICAQCQDALTETEDFLRVVRSAVVEMPAQPPKEASWMHWWGSMIALPKPLLTLVACAIALLIVMPNRSPKSAIVELHTVRGVESAAQAPSHAPLTLRLSVAGIGANEPLEVRVADADGKVVAQAPVQQTGGQTLARVGPLSPGSYWARIYSGEELLREYSFNVR
jgi:hypothetical protein